MSLFLVYPSICEILLQSVNCFPSILEEDDYLTDGPNFDTPVSRLRIIPSIKCTDEDYLNYSYYVFFPGIFVYVVFIPIFSLYKMVKYSGVIYQSSEPSFKQNNTPVLKTINSVKSIYGFFYAGLNLGKMNENVDLAEESGDEDEYGGKKGGCKYRCKKILAPIAGSGVEIKLKRSMKT